MRFPRRLPNLPSGRHILAIVALVSQFLVATGAPLPTARPRSAASATPYPCSEHPCGCINSEQCWAGDCCCMSLEQKLAWAEARGIEPPAHVRPAVEGRAEKPKPAKPKRPCCQGEDELEAACCERSHEPAAPDAVAATPEIRWISSVFKQKCRGEGPAGLLKLEPFAPEVGDGIAARPEPAVRLVPATSEVHISLSYPPQPPPPKSLTALLSIG